MNLEAEILKEHSKRQSAKVAHWVGDDAGKFKELMQLFLRGDDRVTQRSAWIISQCADAHPGLIRPWLGSMLKKMGEPGIHDAVPRNIVRILQFVEIPPTLRGKITAICFDLLNDIHAPIAVKANAMGVLCRIAMLEPGLKHELGLVIRQMLPYGGPAIQARGTQVLRTIENTGTSLRKAST